MLLPCEKFEFPFYFIWIFFSRVAEKKSRKTSPSKIIKNEQQPVSNSLFRLLKKNLRNKLLNKGIRKKMQDYGIIKIEGPRVEDSSPLSNIYNDNTIPVIAWLE